MPEEIEGQLYGIAKYKKVGSIERRLGSGQLSNTMAEMKGGGLQGSSQTRPHLLVFLDLRYGNVQNFSSHTHMNTEHKLVP